MGEEHFDFSRDISFLQRAFFAVWGALQLVLSSTAFQRQGFHYGLLVLLAGILLFCAAVFAVHRLNRCTFALSEQGLRIERGLGGARWLAWNEVSALRLAPGSIELGIRGDAAETFHLADWHPEKRARYFPAFVARLRARALAHRIAVAER